MSTGTVGQSTWTNAGWEEHGGGVEAGSGFAMPEDGWITAMHAFFDTFNGSGAQGHMCIWSNVDGSLLVDSGGFLINNGTTTLGGQQRWDHPVATPVFIAGGTALIVGVYCDQALIFSAATGGNSFYDVVGSGGPTTFHGTQSSIGTIQAYADYATGNVQKMVGGSWTTGPGAAMRSGAQTKGLGYVMRGGVLTPAPLG